MIKLAKWDNEFAPDYVIKALNNYHDKEIEKTISKIKRIKVVPTLSSTSSFVEQKDKKCEYDEIKSSVPKFLKELSEIKKIHNENIEPIAFCNKHPEETRDLILEYYKQTDLVSDKRFYIKCLSSRNNRDLYPFLIEELKIWSEKKQGIDYLLNTFSNFFYRTRNKKYKKLYLKVFSNQYAFVGCYMIIVACGKLHLDEVIPYLLKILNTDESIFGNCALEALGKYKDKEKYKYIFIKYSESDFSYTRNIAKKALKSIENKENKSKATNIKKDNRN